MPAGKRRRTHSREAVLRHFRARYGACPEALGEEIVRRVCERAWSPPVELGRAVDIVATGLVRHQMTDYERLFEVQGLMREEARLIVKAEVDAIIASWKSH